MQLRSAPVLIAVVIVQALLNAGLVGFCTWQSQQAAQHEKQSRAQIAQIQAQLPEKLKELNDDLSGDYLGLKTQVEQQRRASTKQLVFVLEGVAQWAMSTISQRSPNGCGRCVPMWRTTSIGRARRLPEPLIPTREERRC